MIEARSITKFFSVVNEKGLAEGLTAVLNVSLTIPDGKIFSLLGPSGCGKSTFLEILAGLQAPTDGEIRIDGSRVLEPLPSTRKEMEAYKRRYRFISPVANGVFRDHPKHDIAMIFQDYAVFPWMTAIQNVNFALKLHKIPRAQRNERARFFLNRVGLAGVEHKYPSQLSGGMRQRLALARALSVEPKIILMDEPFAAVDALTRERLQDDLLKIWGETGVIIVMVTHDAPEAVYLSDEVVIFSPGPGTIRNRISIDIPRPRRRSDPEIIEIQDRIFAMLQYDLDQESEYSI
ncbi:MAG: ABC transporter ATP-binding protein [Spirochaetales bacterium]|jgi:NitT/TauT family transport system ATP-binding protein|nr:ABC transporter ATP-binding protein [Spirochaetales bacterium]